MVTIAKRGERDLAAVPVQERKKIIEGLRQLGEESPNVDVKALAGHAGWYRLRVGNWRVLYFSDDQGVIIERIVNRRDLERSVRNLP